MVVNRGIRAIWNEGLGTWDTSSQNGGSIRYPVSPVVTILSHEHCDRVRSGTMPGLTAKKSGQD